MAGNMPGVKKLLQEFEEAFYGDDFCRLQRLYGQLGMIEELPYCAEFIKFQQDANLYQNALNLLFSPNWSLVSDTNNIKVETCYSGADFYTRSSVLIPSGIIPTLSIISEIDLLPTWIHALSQVTLLSSPTRFKKLIRHQFWFPWPLTNRECLLDLSAYPVSEKQGMLILMKTPKDYLNVQLPLPDENSVRMEVDLGCIFVQWISPDLTRVFILVKANAKIGNLPGLLPEWLVDFGKKQIMFFLMDALRQAVLGFEGSEYENRVREKAEFYRFLEKVLIEDAGVMGLLCYR